MTSLCLPPISGNSIFRVPQPNRQITPAILESMSFDMSLYTIQRKGSYS